MAKVGEELSTAAQHPGADPADALSRYTGPPVPAARPQGPRPGRLGRSAVGEPWVMAITRLTPLGVRLAHMAWGSANPNLRRGDPYENRCSSLDRVPVAIIYIVAMRALGSHICHGAWSMFQSLGLNSPRWNIWRRYFAIAFAVAITVGNV